MILRLILNLILLGFDALIWLFVAFSITDIVAKF